MDQRNFKTTALSILLLASACGSESAHLDLGRCWNVSQVAPGPVTGRGVFVVSMDGMGLVAPDCDDRAGANLFELSFQADQEIRKFVGPSIPRYLSFAFEGRIAEINGKKKLVISSVHHVAVADQPAWLTEFSRHLSTPAIEEK